MEVIVQMPDELHTKFIRQAREQYGEAGSVRALQEAITLWLEKTPKDLQAERTVNNRAYRHLKADLQRQYQGKYVVIAYGELQGVGDTLGDVSDLAPDARHRLVFRVGEIFPKRKERLWQIRKR